MAFANADVGNVTLREFLRGFVIIGVLYLISGTTADPDLWGHVRFGQDMLAQGGVRLADTYSFTADRSWINHEWLAEILFGAAFNLAGVTGLNLLRIFVVGGVLALVWSASRSLPEPRRMMMLVAGVLGIYMRSHAIRPQLFSLLMFAILLAVLKRADDGRSLRPILWVPVVMAAWVNLHGGWIVGLGFFGLWCAHNSLQGPWPRRLALAVALSAALGATLLNPYGVGMWDFLAATVRLERPMITEWQPLHQRPFAVWMSWLVALGVWAIGAARARSRADWINVGIVAGLGAAAQRVSRLDAFFALAAIFVTIAIAQREKAPEQKHVFQPRPSRVLAATLAVSVLITAFVLVPRARSIPALGVHLPDSEVSAYVRDRKLQGNVLTWFTWGEYFIWHFGPDLKVSMDGRRETVYGPELIDAHLQFYFGSSDEWRYADTLKADYVWIPKRLPVARALQLHGWRTLCSGESSILLTRQPDKRPCVPRAPLPTRSFPQL